MLRGLRINKTEACNLTTLSFHAMAKQTARSRRRFVLYVCVRVCYVCVVCVHIFSILDNY